jgi:hypothetical protein
MVAPRRTHDQRENIVLTELEKSFPNFTGQKLVWVKVPDGQDPPDFISQGPNGSIGLELVEWLDGGQMGPAKTGESRRDELHTLLTLDWESRFRPKHFRVAFPWIAGTEKISRNDQPRLREEFFSLAADIDRNWNAEKRWGNHHLEMDFSAYPTLKKYIGAINFLGGVPDDNCWIHQNGDGGAFDPYAVVRTLESALKNKVSKYSTTEKQDHLQGHGLTELDLLVHGGSDLFMYNSPSGHVTLEEVSKLGADYYASFAERDVFKRVWFFDWIDTMDELNQALGFKPGEGRVRWLAQLWPEFRIYPGSISG